MRWMGLQALHRLGRNGYMAGSFGFARWVQWVIEKLVVLERQGTVPKGTESNRKSGKTFIPGE